MSLSPQQVAQFEKEGWLDLGCVLSQEEIETHRAAYDGCLAALAEQHAENRLPDISRPPRPGLCVHQIRAAHLQHEVFAKIIRRPNITDAVASLVADDLKIILCQGLYKPPRIGGELNWHQDDAYFETESVGHKVAPLVSCWLTLDDATVDSSCMWVLPGEHAAGVRAHATAKGLHLEDVDETKALPVELKAGHAMLHHGAMPHRTLPNTSTRPRRAVAIHYVPTDATTRNASRQREPPENMPRVRSGGSGPKM